MFKPAFVNPGVVAVDVYEFAPAVLPNAGGAGRAEPAPAIMEAGGVGTWLLGREAARSVFDFHGFQEEKLGMPQLPVLPMLLQPELNSGSAASEMVAAIFQNECGFLMKTPFP